MDNSLKFERTDFPALYQLSDESSLLGQQKYLRYFKWEQFMLLAGAIVSLFPLDNPDYGYLLAILAALFFAAAIGLTITMKSTQVENNWYIGRAIAESIKTLTWKYVVKAEPFTDNNPQETVDKKFCGILAAILQENGENLDLTHKSQNNEFQITNKMRELRALNFEQSKELYIENRVKDQLGWYQRKAVFNKKEGTKYFRILIICQSVAMLFSLILIKNPNLFNGVPLITAIAASIIAWSQVKQYEELALAYSTTAQDITLILAHIPYLTDDARFIAFVGDAENASQGNIHCGLQEKTSTIIQLNKQR